MVDLRHFFTIMAVAAFMLPVSSCDKSVDENAEKTYVLEIEATKGQGTVSTRALKLTNEGRTLSALFTSDDVISVYFPVVKSGSNMLEKVGQLAPHNPNPHTSGMMFGNLTGTFYVGDPLLFSYRHYLIFDYKGQDGSLETIAKNYDYAIAQGEIKDIADPYIWCVSHNNNSLEFQSLQAIVKFVLVDGSGSAIVPDKLVIDTAEGPVKFLQYLDLNDPSSPVYGPIEVIPDPKTNEIYVALAGNNDGIEEHATGPIGGVYGAKVVLTATVGGETYKFETPNVVNMSQNKFYIVDAVMTKQ